VIPILNSKQIKSIDTLYKAEDINNSINLMQKAARTVFDVIISKYLDLQKSDILSSIAILCGKGNNGGDGILTANYLLEEGYPVECFILASPDNLSEESKIAYDKLSRHGKSVFIINKDDVSFLKSYYEANQDKHLIIIDALLGIGCKSTPQDHYQDVINLTNQLTNTSNIAIDLPSGTDPDTGECYILPIKAQVTVSMGYPKLGSFFYPARAFYGLTIVSELGYNPEIINANNSQIFFVNNVKDMIPPRVINGSKYDHGVSLLIAGSKGMTGAADLAAKAAYRAGSGLVYLANDFDYQPSVLESIKLSLRDKKSLEQAQSKAHILAVGPGLGFDSEKQILDLIIDSNKPMIIDADAITILSRKRAILKKRKSAMVITPHLGEYKRLFPEDNIDQLSPLEVCETLKARAKEFSMVIVLKGAPTFVASPSGQVYIVPWGNNGLATAGSGDVLTGIISSFAAASFANLNWQPLLDKLTTATIAAVYVHQKCSEILQADLTEYGIIASDIAETIPTCIKNIMLSQIQ